MPYDEYYEDLVVLETVEYKEYSLTFDNPGYKIIQTIGSTDTYIYLIDPRFPDLITNYYYDDDSGDGTNALINKRLASSIIYLFVCARPTIHDDYQTTNIVIS